MKPIELLMDAAAIDRTLTRMAHQILEKNTRLDALGIIGMQTRGVYLAKRITSKINNLEKRVLTPGILDTTFYRDDYHRAFKQPKIKITDIPFAVDDMNLILIDDVLFTGRTVRAALDALIDLGRPKCIQLAVLVDRGHRELPIQPDFVGMNITTLTHQVVSLKVREIDSEDSLWLMQVEEKGA
jgi:pyrimidine operon attenuation protein/uracil phosphoribosyltransferase